MVRWLTKTHWMPWILINKGNCLDQFNKDSSAEPFKFYRVWDKMMSNEHFKSLLSKPVVIIHCLQSTSRTPRFVSSYLKYFAPPGQQVIILEGGFGTYCKKAEGARELWNIAKRTWEQFWPSDAEKNMLADDRKAAESKEQRKGTRFE